MKKIRKKIVTSLLMIFPAILVGTSLSGCAVELSTVAKVAGKGLDVAVRAGEVATAIKTVKQSK